MAGECEQIVNLEMFVGEKRRNEVVHCKLVNASVRFPASVFVQSMTTIDEGHANDDDSAACVRAVHQADLVMFLVIDKSSFCCLSLNICKFLVSTAGKEKEEKEISCSLALF